MKRFFIAPFFALFFAIFGAVDILAKEYYPDCDKRIPIPELDKDFDPKSFGTPQISAPNWSVSDGNHNTVYGTSFCSATDGSNPTPSTSSGSHCWCGITEYNDGYQTSFADTIAWWFGGVNFSPSTCETKCAQHCSSYAVNKPEFFEKASICDGFFEFCNNEPTPIGKLDKEFEGIKQDGPGATDGMSWTLDLQYGRSLQGRAFCSMTAPDTAPTPSSLPGNFCWCGIESYSNGSTTFSSDPITWSFLTDAPSTQDCENTCQNQCLSAIGGDLQTFGNKVGMCNPREEGGSTQEFEYCDKQYVTGLGTADFCKADFTGGSVSGMDWEISFSGGANLYTLSGTSFCSATDKSTAPIPSPSAGQYCWCGIESFSNGVTTLNSNPIMWQGYNIADMNSTSYCEADCANSCNKYFREQYCNATICSKGESTTYHVNYQCDKEGNGSFTDSNTYSSGDPVTTQHAGDICATAPAAGITSDGWYCDNGVGPVSDGGTFTMPANDVTCTVKWNDNPVFTITLRNYNNTSTHDTIYEKINVGWYSDSAATTTISSAPVPTREDYTFRGYYTTTQHDLTANDNTGLPAIRRDGNLPGNNTFNANTNLYDAWARNCAPEDGCTCELYVNEDTGAVTYITSAQPGYHLVSGDGTYAPRCALFTVSFAPNGGSGTMANQTANIGGNITLPANGFTPPTGYKFNGWSCDNGVGNMAVGETFTLVADVTCTAQWVKDIHTITLKNYDNTSTHGTIYEQYNTGWYSDSGATTTISSATVPTRDGYTFRGYYTTQQSDVSMSGSFGTQRITKVGGLPANNTFNANTNLYAAWARNCAPGDGCTCRLTVADNGAVTYSNGALAGYTLDRADPTTQIYTDKYNPTCTAIDYTVSYDIGDGAWVGIQLDAYHHVNETITLRGSSTVTAPSGYTFNGWSCNQGIGNKAAGATFTMPANNVSCTARYQAINYTVSFNRNGGTGTMNSLTNQHVGDTITLPANGFTPPSMKTFNGWSCDNGIGTKVAGETFTMPAANVTCTAQWGTAKPNKYTITLKNYNNTSTHGTIYELYNTGWYSDSGTTTAISSAPVPTRNGYTFRGYYTTQQSDVSASGGSGTQRITKVGGLPASNTFNANTNLYAAWARNCAPGDGCTCRLTVADNGAVTYSNGALAGYTLVTLISGAPAVYNPICIPIDYTVSFWPGTGGQGSTITQTGKHVNDSIQLLMPDGIYEALPGYTFNGWSCNNGIGNKAAGATFTMPAANVTCTAQWQAIDYTVSFDKGTGTGTMSSQTNKHIGDTITLPSSTFTAPSGKEFDKWNCDNSIGDKAPAATFSMPAANVTCTAQYQAINYTVSFNKGNGTGTMSSQTNKHIGDTITLPSSTFTAPSGYAFDKWSCDNDIGYKAVGGTFVMPANDVTCTAVYENNTIALTWDGAGTPTNCTYGSTFNVPTPTPRDGYVFTGWHVIPPYDFATIPTNVNGTNRWAIGWYNNANYCWHDTSGVSCSSDNTYTELQTHEWKVKYSHGELYGMSGCSTTSGTYATAGNPTIGSGQYCWCKATGYKVGGTDVIRKPLSALSWVYGAGNGSVAGCARYCASDCASRAESNSAFRGALFGVQ